MKEDLRTAMKEAMKAKEKVRLETIRAILTAIQYEEVAKGTEDLPKDSIIAILQNEGKKRREAIEFAEKANRAEAIETLKLEIAVIENFLPKQLSAHELEKIVSDLRTVNPALNVGTAMKALKDGYLGQYDGKLASDVVRRVLGQ